MTDSNDFSADGRTETPPRAGAATLLRKPAEPKGGARRRFALSGHRSDFDSRTTAYRGDLADIALAGSLFAPHYAEPFMLGCTAPRAAMRAAPSAGSQAVSEILRGEGFALLDLSGGWAWGYTLHDHYVGYVDAEALGESEKPSHAVTARGALVFAEPAIKSPLLARLPMGARIAAAPSEHDDFLAAEGGFVHRRHAEPLGETTGSPADLAERLVGAPYLWGGRGGDALDCSGLVQMVLGLCGMEAPRDSDQQRESLGRALGEDEAPMRGDLVFFPGHVGIMADGERLIHANAHWMQVTVEPLADVVARFPEDVETPVLARRRIG